MGDELGLAAVSPRRHDTAAGGIVGDRRTVIGAHDVQKQVDAGCRSAEVRTRPASTNSTSGRTSTAGNSAANRSLSAQ
ncbi:hypothetical protein NKG94_00265 [Micromonospora sp. M12]